MIDTSSLVPPLSDEAAEQQKSASPPKLTRKQAKRRKIDLKIAKLPTDKTGRPMVKAVTEGQTTVAISTVVNGNYWQFQVPFYVVKDGVKVRDIKSFSDPDDARVFAATVAAGKPEYMEKLRGLGPEQIAEVAYAIEHLSPFCVEMKITVLQAVDEYIAAKKIAGTKSLVDCMKDYLAQPWVTKCQTPLPEVIEVFLKAKKLRNCKRSTRLKLYYVLNAFSRRINGPAIAAVTKEQIEEEIHSETRADRSNYTYYCELHGFFAWCKRNGFLRPDQHTAMDAIDAPLYDKKRPDVIQPAEVLRLLNVLKDPECILYVVLCLFSGGRCEELNTVRGELVAPGEFLRIDAADAKKRKDKEVLISPLLHQWLQPWYGRGGFWLQVATIQLKIARLIKAHNQTLKETAPATPPVVWKRNWLRHSFATYRLHFTDELIETAEECDHEPETMARYYLVRVSKAETDKYFSLTPEACGLSDWAEIVKAHLEQTPELQKRKTRKKKKKAGLDEDEPALAAAA